MKDFKFYWESSREPDVRISVPGFLKNEISVKLSSTSIRVTAEKKSSKLEKGRGFHREESISRSFSKFISLPHRINPHEFDALISDGEVVLERREQKKKRMREPRREQPG